MASELSDRESYLREEKKRFMEEIKPLVEMGEAEKAIKRIEAASEINEELKVLIIIKDLEQEIDELEKQDISNRKELEMEQDKLLKEIEPLVSQKNVDKAIDQIRIAARITEELERVGNGVLAVKIDELEKKKAGLATFKNKSGIKEELEVIDEGPEDLFPKKVIEEVFKEEAVEEFEEIIIEDIKDKVVEEEIIEKEVVPESFDILESIIEDKKSTQSISSAYDTSISSELYEKAGPKADISRFLSILGLLCYVVGMTTLIFISNLAFPLMIIAATVLVLSDIIPDYLSGK